MFSSYKATMPTVQSAQLKNYRLEKILYFSNGTTKLSQTVILYM